MVLIPRPCSHYTGSFIGAPRKPYRIALLFTLEKWSGMILWRLWPGTLWFQTWYVLYRIALRNAPPLMWKKINFETWRVGCGCNSVLVIRNMHVAQPCLENVCPSKFWSLADFYRDLINRLHIQVRFIGNLCLNGGILWLFDIEDSLCFICKENTETVYHHFIDCPDLGIIIAPCGLTCDR